MAGRHLRRVPSASDWGLGRRSSEDPYLIGNIHKLDEIPSLATLSFRCWLLTITCGSPRESITSHHL